MAGEYYPPVICPLGFLGGCQFSPNAVEEFSTRTTVRDLGGEPGAVKEDSNQSFNSLHQILSEVSNLFVCLSGKLKSPMPIFVCVRFLLDKVVI